MPASKWISNPVFRGSATLNSATGDTLNLPRGGLYIGGTQITASAAQLNAAPVVIKKVLSAQASGLSAAANRVTVGFNVSLPSNAVVEKAWGRISALFGGNAACSSVVMDMGLSGAATVDVDGFMDGTQVLSGAGAAGYVNPRNMAAAQALFSNGTCYVTSATDLPIISLSATGHNMSTLSTGVVIGYVQYVPAPAGSSIP